MLDTNDKEHANEAQIIKHSAYYGETEFSKLLSKKAGLTILSVNIQCINTKFDDFESFINRMNLTNSISVICLQECWLKETDNISMFNLTDYNLVSLPRSCCGHGGLMIYVHNQFKCTPINHNIMKKATDWEYLCVEISHQKHNAKKYIISNIYRKPGEELDEFNVFLEEFTSFIIFIKNQNRPSYLCGDYNIDLLKLKMKNHFNNYFEELVTNGFFPKITLPTRIGERSSSLIDNIFTNDTEEKETAGILLNHLSDHQIIFTYIEKLSYIENLQKFITIEKNNVASVQNFIREMDDLNIYDKLNQSIDSNPEENSEVFLKLIKDVKDKCLHKKVVKYNKKKHQKSKWMTSALLKSINTKNQLYKEWIKTDVNNLDLYSR